MSHIAQHTQYTTCFLNDLFVLAGVQSLLVIQPWLCGCMVFWRVSGDYFTSVLWSPVSGEPLQTEADSKKGGGSSECVKPLFCVWGGVLLAMTLTCVFYTVHHHQAFACLLVLHASLVHHILQLITSLFSISWYFKLRHINWIFLFIHCHTQHLWHWSHFNRTCHSYVSHQWHSGFVSSALFKSRTCLLLPATYSRI